MMKTLIIKELRENFKWLLGGLAVMLVLTWLAVPKDIEHYQSRLLQYLGFAGGLYALALGLIQSVWDFDERHRGYLFHRALTYRQILASKLVAGAIIYAVVMGVPLLFATAYYAGMGLEHLPLRPLQVLAPVSLVALCYALHPAAILAAIRPARWYATKLLPLVVPASACWLYYLLCDSSWLSWVIFGAFSALMLLNTFALRNGTVKTVGMTFGTLIILTGVWVFTMATTEQTVRSRESARSGNRFEDYGVDSNGTIWKIRARRKFDYQSSKMATELVSGAAVRPDLPMNIEAELPGNFAPNSIARSVVTKSQPKEYGQIRGLTSSRKTRLFWDERGYILIYSTERQVLMGTVSRDGFSLGEQLVGKPFTTNPVLHMLALEQFGIYDSKTPVSPLYPNYFIADGNGLYVLNFETGALQVALDLQIVSLTHLFTGNEADHEFLVETPNGFNRYQLELKSQPANPATNLINEDEPQYQIIQIATYPRLPPNSMSYWMFGTTADGKLTALGRTQLGDALLATLDSQEQKQWQVHAVDIDGRPQVPLWLTIGASFLPPVLVISFGVATCFVQRISPISLLDLVPDFWIYAIFALIVISPIFAMVMMLLRNRFTDRTPKLVWLLLTPLLGLAAPIAIIAAYPRLVFERCSKCDRPRRVDQSKCEHCLASWEALPSQGIEIIEGQAFVNVSAAQ
jgi:hypothetical protein